MAEPQAVKALIEKRMTTAIQELTHAYHGGTLTPEYALQGALVLVSHAELLRDIKRMDDEHARAVSQGYKAADSQREGVFSG